MNFFLFIVIVCAIAADITAFTATYTADESKDASTHATQAADTTKVRKSIPYTSCKVSYFTNRLITNYNCTWDNRELFE